MNEQHPNDDLLAAYSAGRSGADEAADVETHLMLCGRCRDVVTVGMVVRGDHARKRIRPKQFILPFAALAAAAALWMRPATTSGLERLGALAHPPAYNGIAVRASLTPGDSLFRLGMLAYNAGRYADAAAALQQSRKLGADSAATTFFIGASALMIGANDRAASELTRSAQLTMSPYTAESHYYLAKALVRMGNPDAAITALRIAGASDNPSASIALALIDSIQRARSSR